MENIKQIKKDLTCWDVLEVSKHIRNKQSLDYLHVENRTDILLECIVRNNFILFEEAINNGFKYQDGLFCHAHLALRLNKIKFLDLLIKNATNEYINKLDKVSQDNLLHTLIKNKDILDNPKELIIKLSKLNVNWNQYNEAKHTPLHMLMRSNSLLSNELVDEIIARADFNIKDVSGFTTLDIVNSMNMDINWNKCPSTQYLMDKLNG